MYIQKALFGVSLFATSSFFNNKFKLSFIYSTTKFCNQIVIFDDLLFVGVYINIKLSEKMRRAKTKRQRMKQFPKSGYF